MSNIDHQCKEYTDNKDNWNLVSDVCAGESRIKAGLTKYLPKPNPDDKSAANKTRYDQYLARAVFYGATGRTLNGLLGAVYKKDPVLDLPAALDYANKNVDGAGVSLFQQSQKVLSAVLKNGRAGLWVDYPQTEGAVSKAQLASVKPRIIRFEAINIINWRTATVDDEVKLSLVVIHDLHEDQTDPYEGQLIEQIRVLRLEDGIYSVELWRKPKNAFELVDSFVPTDGSGKPWREIPFVFVGSENNDPTVDAIPLLDLANINLAHYRNSADYEDSVYFCGQPQPWISGLDEEWRNYFEEKGIYIGARAPMLLPENGAFGFAQAQPNTLVKEAMDQKEQQMIALGARLVERGSVAKTATEAQNENESQHSVLSLAASNVSDAYQTALTWAALFANSTDAGSFELNKDFIEATLDAQMLQAIIAAWQNGTLPSADLWDQFRKYGLIDPEKSDEDIQEEIENSPKGLALEDGD